MKRESHEVEPCRAPVRPRVADTRELLEDAVRDWIDTGAGRRSGIAGGPLAGKSAAIAHVRAVVGERAGLGWMDSSVVETERAVFTTPTGERRGEGPVFHLAPWGVEEADEYLFHAHPDRRDAAMRRVIESAGLDWLGGSPALWRMALDALAADDATHDLLAALHRAVLASLDEEAIAITADWAMLQFTDRPVPMEGDPSRAVRFPGLVRRPGGRLLVLRSVGLLLAGEVLARRVARGEVRLSQIEADRDLFRSLGLALRRDPDGLGGLFEALRHARDRSWADTVLGEAGFDFRPAERAHLAGANLKGIRWPRTNLRRAELAGANLSGADLTGADLEGSDLRGATLEGACLVEASLRGAVLASAAIDGADLTGACLDRARLIALPLHKARLVGATFREAILHGCDLEGIRLEEPDLSGADLREARLTASVLVRPRMHRARLRSAGLVGIDWEGADLREADLTGARFDAGTTRSGIFVLPSGHPTREGSRAGFSADERFFLDPREFRIAGLCGADLRGARIAGVDFYLVDLRRAIYDAAQAEHFRRCGAIL